MSVISPDAIIITIDQPSQPTGTNSPSRTSQAYRTGHASCEINGTMYHAKSRAGAVCELCRVLVAAGVADGPWQAYRAGRLVMFGRSVHALARRAVAEDDKRGPRFVVWKPYPERERVCEVEEQV